LYTYLISCALYINFNKIKWYVECVRMEIASPSTLKAVCQSTLTDLPILISKLQIKNSERILSRRQETEVKNPFDECTRMTNGCAVLQQLKKLIFGIILLRQLQTHTHTHTHTHIFDNKGRSKNYKMVAKKREKKTLHVFATTTITIPVRYSFF
jgi:hypothetical protein